MLEMANFSEIKLNHLNSVVITYEPIDHVNLKVHFISLEGTCLFLILNYFYVFLQASKISSYFIVVNWSI